MFCKNCGNESSVDKKFCTKCGTAFSSLSQNHASSKPFSLSKKFNREKIIPALVIVILIVWGAYSSLDDSSIKTNNNALSSYNSGNSEQAITQFQQASKDAVTNDTKINTLKNLAYVYATDGKNEEALNNFQQALKLAGQNSFDHYLISAEIALLEGKPNSAYLGFAKALEIQPNDFQVNNSLAIFYMNLDGSSADYENYPKALSHALKANNLNGSEITRENLGVAYFWNKNYDESISILSQTNITQHPFVGFWLGYDYAAKDDVAKAKYYFRQAINAGGTPPQEVTDYLNNN